MRGTIAAIVALTGVVVAQDLSGIPGCALVCALGAGKKAGCTAGDVKCFCTSEQAMSAAHSCVVSSCSEADANKAVTGAATLCASIGITPAFQPRAAGEESKPAAAAAPGPAEKDNAAAATAAASSSAPAVAAGSSSASTSCLTLSKASSASSSAHAASTTSVPATFTGAAASNVRGAGAALAGAAFMIAAAL